VVEEQGKLDVLINNAGFSVAGSADDTPLASAQSMFDTNLWGIARTVKAALPHFRRQAGGQIINVSSVGGLVGFPFQEYYCASKWAVEGYTESLAISNAHLNVKVSLVEPGAIRTPFFANAQSHVDFADPGVKALWDRFVAGMATASTNTQLAQTAEEVAEVIKTVVDAEKPHLRYQSGVASKAVAAGVRVDPTGDASVQAQVARFFKN
jgi:NAD(P)-dependent dehydrogenase (short-subunit alcohol dehydrogenase family)